MPVLPPSMVLPALLLLAVLQPAQLATGGAGVLLWLHILPPATDHGCLLRSNSTADGGTSIDSVPQPTAADCANACSLHDQCDSFVYDGSNCHLKSYATVKPGPAGLTAGWCPNGGSGKPPGNVLTLNLQERSSSRMTE